MASQLEEEKSYHRPAQKNRGEAAKGEEWIGVQEEKRYVKTQRQL